MYAVFGLIAGFFFSIVSLFMATSSDAGFGFDMIFGIGAVILLPVFYGVLGFISGLIGAAIYNVVARVTGGLEMEFEATDA
jgi:hypothetical protein